MIKMKFTFALAVIAVAAFVTGCGSDPAETGPGTRSNAMQVVAGAEDAVEPDGSITLTSAELATCKSFVTQAGTVHENMTAMAEMAVEGSTGTGWQSYTAGVPGWLQKLSVEKSRATTPEFAAALGGVAQGGDAALTKINAGAAPTAEDYDAAAIATGLRTTAGLCEAAGVNITWHG